MSSDVLLVITTGLQGTGKSTVAKKIAGILGAHLLRTDVIRRELFHERQYTQEETERVYAEMFERARKLLQRGNSVVLDAMFVKEYERVPAREIAERLGIRFQIVEIICEEEVVKQRIKERSGDASEATFEHYLMFKDLMDPVRGEHITIDNSGILDDLDAQLELFT